MPVALDKEYGSRRLILWKIDEGEQELRGMVTASDAASSDGFAKPGRRLEHLAWRAALRRVVPQGEVVYESTGAPGIAGDVYFGAAHTAGMAAVLTGGGRPCAVDVEAAGRNFSRTASRFISDAERVLDEGWPLFECFMWCAKETMYKASGRRGLDFKADLRITALDPETGTAAGEIADGERIALKFIEADGFIVVFTA